VSEQAWVPVGSGGLSNWRPLPELYPDWIPVKSDIRPFIEIRMSRSNQDSGQHQILSEKCVEVLRVWWNGDANALLPQDKMSCDSHFHCYSTQSPSGRIHRSFADWRERLECDDFGNWWCSGIRNAGEHYSWMKYEGGTLEQLGLALQSAMATGDNELAKICCLKILDWGGVRHRSQKTLDWIYSASERGALICEIKEATSVLCPNSIASLDCFGIGENKYPMNSGSTKIFAAAALDFSDSIDSPKQDVIIFDGRVGASLGLIASRLSTTLPSEFLFPRGDQKQRNPSTGTKKFPAMSMKTVSDEVRARFARKSARIIQEVLGNYAPSTEFALAEKALFMMGYNVTQNCAGRRI